MRKELEITGKKFQDYIYSSGLVEKPAPERWVPEPWGYEVCCMPGMACWTGDFANAAGRAEILRELEKNRGEMERAKAHFDELDKEN